jgi:hypothetical protein
MFSLKALRLESILVSGVGSFLVVFRKLGYHSKSRFPEVKFLRFIARRYKKRPCVYLDKTMIKISDFRKVDVFPRLECIEIIFPREYLAPHFFSINYLFFPMFIMGCTHMQMDFDCERDEEWIECQQFFRDLVNESPLKWREHNTKLHAMAICFDLYHLDGRQMKLTQDVHFERFDEITDRVYNYNILRCLVHFMLKIDPNGRKTNLGTPL